MNLALYMNEYGPWNMQHTQKNGPKGHSPPSHWTSKNPNKTPFFNMQMQKRTSTI